MRWVVDGCSPVLALISLSEIASSREARTSMSANMRSITWIVGVAGWPLSVFRGGRGTPRFYLVKRRRKSIALDPGSVAQHLVRTEVRLVAHLGALADPVAEV